MQENRLTLQSVGSSSVWPGLIERTNVVVGFDINTQDDPYLPTDSMTFYQAGVPALNLFTGAHDDYHRPSDTADRINYEDLERVARFTSLLGHRLRELEDKPAYAEMARPESSDTDRDTVRAYTGTIPDYTQEAEGLLLGGVVGDGPADQAGLRKGDIIIEFAGRTITNIYDYTFALDVAKAGEPVKVVFLRDGERRETTIVPATRK
jgi:C-terminal processing protease CtpA/Prc